MLPGDLLDIENYLTNEEASEEINSSCSVQNTYHELMSHLVCSVDNRDCMLRHCSNCLTSENLKRTFEEWDEDEVTYSAWVTTDRTQQVTLTVSLEEYYRNRT
ncbi:hypothetical protein J6590_028178 [Homalodisca vitripennis]|nr:hypothetical protein J6590_028178 [Homalodisca vitripennis]